MRIGIKARVKQGDILEALQKRGWTQRKGAEFVNMNESDFGKLVNLEWVPEVFKPELERKLFELTGKTIDELFPESARQPEFLRMPKTFSRIREVTPEMLRGSGALFLPPSPQEIVESLEMQEGIRAALLGLSPKEEKVIRMRFFEDKSFEEISQKFDVAGWRIKAIHQGAMRKLRAPENSKRLRPLL